MDPWGRMMRKDRAPAHVTEAILGVVENQIRANDPPQTATTLKRLLADGISRPEAIRMIACCVTEEIFHIGKYGETFSEKRYVSNLNKLPSLPG
jgi:hypothetical protein